MTTAELKTVFPYPAEWIRKRKVKDNAGNFLREFENTLNPSDGRIIVTDPTDQLIVDIIECPSGSVTTEALKDSTRWWATPGATPPLAAAQASNVPFKAVCGSCHSSRDLCLDMRPDVDDFDNPPPDEEGVHLKFKRDGSILLTWDEGAGMGWHKPSDRDVARIRAFPFIDGAGCLFTCDCVEDETMGIVTYADGTVDQSFDCAETLAGKIIRGEVPIK